MEQWQSDDNRSSPRSPPKYATSSRDGSAFNKQTLQASQITELTSTELFDSAAVMDELTSLRGLLLESETSPSEARIVYKPAQGRRKEPALPPISSEFVLRLLRTLTDKCSMLFLFNPVEDLEQVEELCKRVYFPVDPLTVGEVTLFNGVLFVILSDVISSGEFGTYDDEQITKMRTYQEACQTNFMAGLETYEVVGIPTYEHTLALCIGMVYALTEGNPVLHEKIASTAARHCLALGYHHEEHVSQLPPNEAKRVRRLFWFLYMFDKNLVLRNGRAPIIQDYDVSLTELEIVGDPGRAAWDMALKTFNNFTLNQAKMYEKLYSPGSKKYGTEERQAIVDDLVENLERWYESWVRIDISNAHRADIFMCAFGAHDVIYYSALTVIHRGVATSNSATDIPTACFEAAKNALTAHLSRYPRLLSTGSGSRPDEGLFYVNWYANWLLMLSSFTPYIVTFLHCIGYSDTGDLKLLKSVLDTIEEMCSLRPPLQRQFEICGALYRIADRVISQRTTMTEPNPLQGMENQLPLHLQPTYAQPWPGLDSWPFMDDWTMSDVDQMSFTLNNRL